MWSFGLLTAFLGYAFIYTAVQNAQNGGQGPSLAEAIGIPRPVLTRGSANRTVPWNTSIPTRGGSGS